MIKSLMIVGLGGAAGSMLRFVIQKAINTSYFPYGTLLVNVIGCFLIGLLPAVLGRHSINEALRLLLMTGFCGGFTTFSAFTYESIQLLNSQKWFLFFGYIAASVVLGLAATFTGYKLMN